MRGCGLVACMLAFALLAAPVLADVVVGSDGPDQVLGTPGDDALYGRAGDDLLDGAAGDDTLDGGPGADDLRGGPGRDAVSYAAATASVTVSLDDARDDGEGADNVRADVEDVYLGPGNDQATGSAAGNVLDGGAGDDTLDGGAGPDALYGGPGRDTLRARDGGPDIVDCGPGDGDSAAVDLADTVTGCEFVDRPPPTARIDPVVSSLWSVDGVTTNISFDVDDLPAGAQVELTCRGRGCRTRRRVLHPRGPEVDLHRLLRGARLRPGAVVEVRITAPDAIGKLLRYRIRAGALPLLQRRCLSPGDPPRVC